MADTFIKWQIQPLSRILFIFFAGNLLAESAGYTSIIYWLSIFILGLFLLFIKRSNKFGLLIGFFILLNGMLNFMVQKREIKKFITTYHILKILPEPSYKNGKVIIDAKLIGIFNEGKWAKTNGKARIEIELSKSMSLFTGDYLLVYGNIERPITNLFPKLFDYRSYLETIGIDYFLKTDERKIATINNSQFNLSKFAIQIRDRCIENIEQHNIKKDLLAVVSALILGTRSELDKQLIKDYTQCGIVHILAVSGLHVGLIYVAFLFLLNPFKKFLPKIVFVLSVIGFLWFYAILTGLSPSVVRASAMCTFIVIATTYNLKITNFNLLASVAFFMILFDASIWKQLGFQLSFAAVWSIFAFKPILDFGNKFKNWFIRNIYKAAALSFVAQLATFPLCSYYFGTFPSYFLLANLIAVPLSTLLTYLGISAMVLGSVPFLGFLLAKWLEIGISWMNSFAHFVSSLPYAIIQNIFISRNQAICLALFIFIFSMVFIHFNSIKLKLLLFCWLIFSVFQTSESYYTATNIQYFILSNTSKNQVIIIKGKKFIVVNLGKSKTFKYIDKSTLELANHLNLPSNSIVVIDSHSTNPTRKFYFRYLQKCVLAS